MCYDTGEIIPVRPRKADDPIKDKGGFPMELKHLNEAQFNEVLTGTKPALIDFSAVWCGPCGRLAPLMETLADRYGERAVVAKVDVDEERLLAQRYQITSVPTVLLIKDGGEAARLVGVRPMEDYTALLDAAN